MIMLIGINAAPVRKALSTYTQPDGTTITVRLCGDEYHHFYTTEEGIPVTLCDDGYYRYTTIDAQDNLVAGNDIVGCALPMSIDAKQSIMARHKELHQASKSKRHNEVTARRAPMRHAAQNTSEEKNDVRGLIILAEFQDKKFSITQSSVNERMNQEGYTDSYGSIGSARDYFIAQSYGQFKPNFDVVGPITLSQNMSYYGGNDPVYDQDLRPDVMVSEACELASEQGLVNMSDYDLNNDGWVDLVYVIYAGYAENESGVDSNTVWPHAWYIYQGAKRTVVIDGVQLDAYACSSELTGNKGTTPDGIGTFCHEYSHTLGLPDMYDIDYSGGVGMMLWSIMDEGCNTGNGYVPIAYSAYERAYCGWLELKDLTESATISMPDLKTDKTAAYRISTSNPNQYLTLETRKQEGWDAFLPSEGMMVWAIDYNKTVWSKNAPNDNPSRQRIQLIAADNDFSRYTLSGDLYPHNNNNSLTSTSTPLMKVYNTTIKNKPITNIAYNEGVTTFDFMGGSDGIEGVVDDNSAVYYNGQQIVIRNNQAAEAYIYNIQGMCVAVVGIENGEGLYRPSQSGLYVVRCGNNSIKINIQ